jgi:hypothetical protein
MSDRKEEIGVQGTYGHNRLHMGSGVVVSWHQVTPEELHVMVEVKTPVLLNNVSEAMAARDIHRATGSISRKQTWFAGEGDCIVWRYQPAGA